MTTPDLQPQPLPFSPVKQDALVGHLLCGDKFFMQARDLITPDLLVDPWSAKLWTSALAFAALWKRPPTESELRESSSISSMEQGARNKIYVKITQCKDAVKRFGLEPLRAELDDWIHGAIYRRAVETSATLYNKGKFKEAFEEMRSGARSIDNVSFTETPEVDFSNGVGFLSQQKEDISKAMTFGVSAMDKLLLEGGNGGSLLPGDMTVLLAPTNIGKTTCMVTIARHNILRGKSVLFLTHEGRPTDISEKIWRSVMKVDNRTLYEMQTTTEGQQKIANATRYLSRFFTYLPIHRPSLTVEELEGVIRRLDERRRAKYGSGYDLIVDDYPAKLTCQMASKGNMQRRQKDEYVYDYLNRLASEMGFHCLTAIQGNRESSKINRREAGTEDRLLTPEDVAESFGAMMVATNVITINRDPIAIADGRVTYYIGKSRSSETGWAVVCRSDYRRATTHSDDLGATWYRGQGTMSDKINALLEQHKGQAIPEHHWGF